MKRRRLITLIVVAAIGGAALAVIVPEARRAVREITLPLHHEDIIRQQATAKNLDPALVAAVIFAESKFREGQTSPTGAEGLMQIQPATALFLAHHTGGTRFRVADLGTPQVNITYGTYYLRYLLDRYSGSDVLALAAYNAGEANVDRWVAQANTAGHDFTIADIPFSETRAYVQRVLDARAQYRQKYPTELGYG